MKCIRMDLDPAFRELIADRLARLELQSLPAPDSRRAAVALALIEEGTGAMLPGIEAPAGWSRSAAVLLTRRSEQLRKHPGQWALPGGAMDEGETPEQAALRELHEEVGLRLEPSAVLGRLDDFVTRS